MINDLLMTTYVSIPFELESNRDIFLTTLKLQVPSLEHAGIIVIPSADPLSKGGSISKTYIKCSDGKCCPRDFAALGSFQATVTSRRLELLALGKDLICES